MLDEAPFCEKLERGDIVPRDQTVTIRVHHAKKKIRGKLLHCRPFCMIPNRLVFTLLLLLSAASLQLHAQQSEEDRKLLAEIRTKAEKGDAQSQGELGAVLPLAILAWQMIMPRR